MCATVCEKSAQKPAHKALQITTRNGPDHCKNQTVAAFLHASVISSWTFTS